MTILNNIEPYLRVAGFEVFETKVSTCTVTVEVMIPLSSAILTRTDALDTDSRESKTVDENSKIATRLKKD